MNQKITEAFVINSRILDLCYLFICLQTLQIEEKKEGRERKSVDNVSDSKYHGEPEVFRKAEEFGVGQHIEGVRKVIKM